MRKPSEVFGDFGRSVVAILRRVPVLSPARETQVSAECPPSLRSSARSIPKGFQPIAGGERSVTTGQWPPSQAYPVGIAALRVVDSRTSAGIPAGYGSLWMLETGGVRCARPPAMGCDPCGVEEWLESQGILRRIATTLLRKSRRDRKTPVFGRSGRMEYGDRRIPAGASTFSMSRLDPPEKYPVHGHLRMVTPRSPFPTSDRN